jgi:hypothetical protein
MCQTIEVDSPLSPFRPPAWRWQRACYLAEHEQRASARRDDEHVREALRFCRLLRRCSGQQGLVRLARQSPALYEAWLLFRDSSLRRWELEARILAGQSSAAIAARCCLPVAVLDAYHHTFFSVREHLTARDWVMCRVLGPQLRSALTASNAELVLKYYGFIGGAVLVDDLLAYFSHPVTMPTSLIELDEQALADLRHHLGIKAALLVRSLRVDEAGVRKLLMLRDRCESERSKDQEKACPLIDRVLPLNPFAPAQPEPSVVVPAPAASVIHPLWLLWPLDQAA